MTYNTTIYVGSGGKSRNSVLTTDDLDDIEEDDDEEHDHCPYANVDELPYM